MRIEGMWLRGCFGKWMRKVSVVVRCYFRVYSGWCLLLGTGCHSFDGRRVERHLLPNPARRLCLRTDHKFNNYLRRDQEYFQTYEVKTGRMKETRIYIL